MPARALWCLTFIFAANSYAESALPDCPVPKARLAPKNLGDLPLPPDVEAAAWGISGNPVAIDAGYDHAGDLKCATPVGGPAIFLKYGVAAIPRKAVPNTQQVMVFESVTATLRKRWPNEPKPGSCQPRTLPLAALKAGVQNESIDCLKVAVLGLPDSYAAHEALASAAFRVRDFGLAKEQYSRAAELASAFDTAPLFLALVFGQMKDDAAKEHLLLQIASTPTALPVRAHLLFPQLRFLYDQQKRRPEAAEAEKQGYEARAEIHARFPDKYDTLSFFAGWLALRFEEIGEYKQANHYYTQSAESAATDKMVSDAFRYESDLGRARTLRKLGDGKSAQTICDKWRKRIRGFRPSLNNLHWNGKAIAQARWEFSCGDFQKGLSLVQQAKMQDKGYVPVETPYQVLEEAYRARGQSDLADQELAAGDKLKSRHDNAVIHTLFGETEDAIRSGKATVIQAK